MRYVGGLGRLPSSLFDIISRLVRNSALADLEPRS